MNGQAGLPAQSGESVDNRPLIERHRDKVLTLSQDQLGVLCWDWRWIARRNQLPPPGDWRYWLVLAGRGFGKTRSGAEWVRMKVAEGCRRIALVGATAADVRDTMVEGEAGIIACSPPWDMPVYNPSRRRLTWPNGAAAITFSADVPSRLRGPQHDAAWCDELCAWRSPEAFDMLMMGLRKGSLPQVMITTTPRPTPQLKKLLSRKTGVVVTRGNTFENDKNLAASFLEEMRDTYGGTRLGRQELFAEILEDSPLALWKRSQLDADRVSSIPGQLRRLAVAVDPAATSGEQSAETGIMVGGIGEDKIGYLLDDMSLRGSPDQWGRQVAAAYHKYKASSVVAEANQGGEMIVHVLRTIDRNLPVKLVHATRGKYTRAEPVAALCEQHKIKHVGQFPALEDQLCQWEPGDNSPDRLDAYAWLWTHLMITPREARSVELVGFY